MEEWVSVKSNFLWGFDLTLMSKRIARRAFSSVWVALYESLAVVGKNYLQVG